MLRQSAQDDHFDDFVGFARSAYNDLTSMAYFRELTQLELRLLAEASHVYGQLGLPS